MPEGRCSSGLQNLDFAMRLGTLVAYWPHLEERASDLMRELIGGPRDTPSRQIFRAVVSQDARIKVMRALLQESPKNQNKGAVFDAMINEFEELNRARNK